MFFFLKIDPATRDKLDRLGQITGKSSKALVKQSFANMLVSNINPIILVLQMGKVGSSAIAEAIEATGQFNVVHVHHLNEQVVSSMEARNAAADRKNAPNLRRSRGVLDWVRDTGEVFDIVSAVRDPVARNLSAFFQNHQTFLTIENKQIKNTPDEIADIFIRTYTHKNALAWFDMNLKKGFGLDVYDHPFDRERGCLIANHDSGKRLIVVRSEDDDNLKARAIADFLRIRELSLGRANVGEEKKYSDLYRRVVDEIAIPADLLDEIYDSPYVRHFYNSDEIAVFRARWGQRNRRSEETCNG